MVTFGTEKRCATIDNLPFKELQFDTVTCMEVLEHLPLPIYARSLSEVARVARQSIIVCVPYNQNLRASLGANARNVSHNLTPTFTLRSFDENALRGLFLPHSFQDDRNPVHWGAGCAI